MTTPFQIGFSMPAEWAPHQRCWMAWPCRDSVWGDSLDAARRTFSAVARAVARFEPVTMLARPELVDAAAALCGPSVEVSAMAMDDSWTRDTGPVFIRNSEGVVAGCDWGFNGWGGKEVPHEADADMAQSLLSRLGLECFSAPAILEGGAVHVDGEGTLITTDSVLLNPNRNPGMDRETMEGVLREYLGVKKVIWLAGGLAGDMTDGHVDNVACFVRPGVVLAQTCDDPSDPNHAVLRENYRILDAAHDAKGRALTVLPIVQPQPDAAAPLVLSYVNFYIANGGVVMPAFKCSQDNAAFAVIARAFPDREIVQIDAGAILKGGGGIHCITQQQPRGITQP